MAKNEGLTMEADRHVVTPELLRVEAYEMAKYQRKPGPGPSMLVLMADLIDTAKLDTPKPCPTCGRDCQPCTGAHPAYDLEEGRLLRIAIVDYLCRDCPDVWAHWAPIGVVGERSAEEEATDDNDDEEE